MKTGFAPGGRPIWTPAEIKILDRFHPDYARLLKRLPNRTYEAIKQKARSRGLVPTRHIWTAAEASRLRRMYPKAPKEELLASFPGLSWQQISAKAKHIGVQREKRPLVPTGHALLDEIRARATSLGYSMGDVDELARTRTYFRKAGWCGHQKANAKHAGKAVAALGGRLSAQWQDE